MTLTLKNAPLVEVVFGIDFEEIEWLRSTHFGLYWGTIGERFPISEDHPPIGELKLDPQNLSLPPLRRTWFISEDQSSLLQLQNNKFLLNWRKTKGSTYPRFPNLKESFFKEFASFKGFVSDFYGEDFKFSIKGCELSYINIVDNFEDWSNLENVTKILPQFDWRNTDAEYLASPKKFRWSSEFEINDEMVLKTVAKSVMRKVPNDEKRAFQLDLHVSGLNVDKSESGLSDWFDSAHETIINGFKDLTSQSTQENWWGKTDE